MTTIFPKGRSSKQRDVMRPKGRFSSGFLLMMVGLCHSEVSEASSLSPVTAKLKQKVKTLEHEMIEYGLIAAGIIALLAFVNLLHGRNFQAGSKVTLAVSIGVVVVLKSWPAVEAFIRS